ncbi:MAG: hypothetical protein ACFFAY_13675, partial [Promethearchaeota archaeon]
HRQRTRDEHHRIYGTQFDVEKLVSMVEYSYGAAGGKKIPKARVIPMRMNINITRGRKIVWREAIKIAR